MIKNHQVDSVCLSTLIYTNGTTTVSRCINNRLNCCKWQGTPLFTTSILELLQRLWLYRTLANTSFMRIPFGLYREAASIAKRDADMFIVCCAPDTNCAGLNNYVTLKLNLRKVGFCLKNKTMKIGFINCSLLSAILI